jgi:periplasmic protein TonB
MRLLRLLTTTTVLLTAAAMAEVRVQPGEAMRFATSKTQPEYNAIAKQMKVTGRADIEVVIAADGTIESVKAVSGNPLLTGPAVTAVKKWKFNPIVVDGQPAKVITTLAFDFK